MPSGVAGVADARRRTGEEAPAAGSKKKACHWTISPLLPAETTLPLHPARGERDDHKIGTRNETITRLGTGDMEEHFCLLFVR